jgi:hypothetical protein
LFSPWLCLPLKRTKKKAKKGKENEETEKSTDKSEDTEKEKKGEEKKDGKESIFQLAGFSLGTGHLPIYVVQLLFWPVKIELIMYLYINLKKSD